MTATSIEWTDATWNPTRGCRRISLGCGGPRNEGGCYAERQAIRFAGPGGRYEGLVETTANGPRWTGAGRLAPEMLCKPLSWREPRMVFVDSMSDLFYDAFSNEDIAAVFFTMAIGAWHTYQALTKRSSRMLAWLRYVSECPRPIAYLRQRWEAALRATGITVGPRVRALADATLEHAEWPLPNFWPGVSTENQPAGDDRIPDLLRCPVAPTAKRFISYEPALGALDVREWLPGNALARALHHHNRTGHDCSGFADQAACELCNVGFGPEDPTLDWVICGAESGPRNRPMETEWARSIRDQCVDAGVPFMLKQFATEDGKKKSLPRLDGKRWAQIPPRGAA